ncbi:methyltransferase-like protein 27 [Diadema antillarum]|uniref:methyltransferase-like protein 27 n=1 Tax=Diadema antillarum TaxID=105358 RepID=UPI003A8650AC
MADEWKLKRLLTVHTLKDQTEVKQLYDESACYYDEVALSIDYVGSAFTAEVVAKMEPNQDARILDVGCGTGLVGDGLHKAGYRNLYGVDLSAGLLDVLRKKGTYCDLTEASFGPLNSLNFTDGYFDVAMSSGSFLPTHLNEKCLPEMIRLVKSGGFIVITTRKYIFDGETGDMKLKPGLAKLVEDGLIEKVRHEESLYFKDPARDNHVIGITLVYKVL